MSSQEVILSQQEHARLIRIARGHIYIKSIADNLNVLLMERQQLCMAYFSNNQQAKDDLYLAMEMDEAQIKSLLDLKTTTFMM